jgi:hypothetical protein
LDGNTRSCDDHIPFFGINSAICLFFMNFSAARGFVPVACYPMARKASCNSANYMQMHKKHTE